ncbi:MAG TPA: DUF1294 domain-containing protein [Burkholderiaceae bacterium]|nr:DUF1294 domain-containing protein [Burkholderiaceae bacterium]HMZ00550.1 DUF1294 domain-containing protein [Burkholderiaceae bacterium]HNG79110.1 DUF1294 domain-containing protein [Burkholderiaceae bacterium]
MDEEGYIVRWDAARGEGEIRASYLPQRPVVFRRAQLCLGAAQPRPGMAVVFRRVEPSDPSAGDPDEALDVRPWASALATPQALGSARRQQHPVFQSTGSGSLAPALDPLTPAKAAPPSRLSRAPSERMADDRAGPASTRPAPLPNADALAASRSLIAVPTWPGALALAGYLGLLGLVATRGRLPLLLTLAAPLLWVLTFAAYWVDKHIARTRATRDRETTLHLLDALGGWPGGWLAMQWLPHKRRRAGFRRRFWLIAALHSLLVGLWLGLGRP